MDKKANLTKEAAASRLLGMIGLARRAGRLNYGFDAALKDIEAGKTKAVLLSNDASPRTADKIRGACERCGVEYAVMSIPKAELGQAIGKGDIAVMTINDKSFADRILELANAAEFDISGGNESDKL